MKTYIERDTYTGRHSVTRRNAKASTFLASELAAMAPKSVIFESVGSVNGCELFARTRYVADADGNLHCYDSEGALKITHPAGRKLRVLVG